MKRIALLFSLIHVIATGAFAQYNASIANSMLPVLNAHYQPEYTFDKPVNAAAWTAQQPGLHSAFGSTDRLYFRTEVPAQHTRTSWEATGWKGERLNTQLLVWSPDTLQQVRFTLSDLVSAKGNTISSQQAKLQMVRYVVSNYPYGAKDAVCGESPYKEGYLMPDRFEAFDRFDLPGRTVRPVWLSLEIPADAAPGNYTT